TRVGSRVFFTAMNESFARDLWVAELLPGLAVEDTSVYARPGGSEEAVFRVRLSPTTSDVVSVDFATEAATAVPGSDFVPASGSLRFLPGQTLQVIRISVSRRVDGTGDRTFVLRLANADHARIDRGRATGTIRDPTARSPVLHP